MWRNFTGFLFGVLLSTNIYATGSENLDDYVFITENSPPTNFEENGIATGSAVDILIHIFSDLKINKTIKDIQILPWANGYHQLLTKPNNVLFATTRTEERENLFKWVGPIITTKIVVFGLKDLAIKITKPEDMQKYEIGAVKSDIGEILLRSVGLTDKNISTVAELNQNIRKTETGRISLFVSEDKVMKWDCKKEKLDCSKLEEVYELKKADLYYAFSKDTPDSVIAIFQESLNKMKAAGPNAIPSKYDVIMSNYK